MFIKCFNLLILLHTINKTNNQTQSKHNKSPCYNNPYFVIINKFIEPFLRTITIIAIIPNRISYNGYIIWLLWVNRVWWGGWLGGVKGVGGRVGGLAGVVALVGVVGEGKTYGVVGLGFKDAWRGVKYYVVFLDEEGTKVPGVLWTGRDANEDW